MKHQTARDSANRHGNAQSRVAVEAPDDTKFIQETHFRGLHEEQQDGIEHLHPYGFTSVVQKPTGKGALRQAAESVLAFLGGNRTHGVSIVTADRRYRLYKLQNGEVALHDDQGHQVHIARDGVYVSAPSSKKVVAQIMADDVLPQDSKPQADGQKLGQVQQKGRTVLASYSIDKNSFTVNHPTAIHLTAPMIVLDGETHLGGPEGVLASKKGTIDDDGDVEIRNLAKKVYVT